MTISTTSLTSISQQDRKFKEFFKSTYTQGKVCTQEGTVKVTSQEKNVSLSNDIGTAFAFFLNLWRKETQVLSSPSAIISGEAYREIIRMGKSVLPLILADLRENKDDPDFWFPALQAIIGDGPTIPETIYGNMPEMAQAWLFWVEENNVLQVD